MHVPDVREGRPLFRATGPLPCTKSFLQSHSAAGATANTVCASDCITKR